MSSVPQHRGSLHVSRATQPEILTRMGWKNKAYESRGYNGSINSITMYLEYTERHPIIGTGVARRR